MNEPKDFIRYPDAIVGGIGKEAKTGYVKRSERILKQIEKDVSLRNRGELRNVEWHFFASGRSDSIGADPAILDALDRAGIQYFFHIP